MADGVHTGPLVRVAEAQRAVVMSVFRRLHAVRELFGTSHRNDTERRHVASPGHVVKPGVAQ